MFSSNKFFGMTSCVIVTLASVGIGTPAMAATSTTVPYFHDFLGGVCVRDEDLETAYLVGTKGVRPPPLCIEDPCNELLDRDTYDREILGRASTETEWTDYQSMQGLVCAEGAPSDILTMLLPFDYDVDLPIPSADPIFGAGDSILAYVAPWIVAGSEAGPSFVDYRKPNTGSTLSPIDSPYGGPVYLTGGGSSSSGSNGTSSSGSSSTDSASASSSGTTRPDVGTPRTITRPSFTETPVAPVPVPSSLIGGLSGLSALLAMRAYRRRST